MPPLRGPVTYNFARNPTGHTKDLGLFLETILREVGGELSILASSVVNRRGEIVIKSTQHYLGDQMITAVLLDKELGNFNPVKPGGVEEELVSPGHIEMFVEQIVSEIGVAFDLKRDDFSVSDLTEQQADRVFNEILRRVSLRVRTLKEQIREREAVEARQREMEEHEEQQRRIQDRKQFEQQARGRRRINRG